VESEFDEDSWLTLPASSEHIFWMEENDLWKALVSEVNARTLSEFLGLSGSPSDPE
jgi:putative AlgH/UPF0301 family transcriptional regulator